MITWLVILTSFVGATFIVAIVTTKAITDLESKVKHLNDRLSKFEPKK
jgi:hypothetical protein